MKENDFGEPEVVEPRVTPVGPAPRPSWANVRSSFRAWAYHTFSASSLLSGLKSLAWVAPLSVLIWIYAEREQISKDVPLTCSLQIKSLDPSRVVRLLDPADGKLRGDFSGPQGGMDQVREQLESGVPVQVDLGDGELTPGAHPVLSTRINQDALLVKNGISVSNCIPHAINIFVDKLEEVTVDVQAPADAKNIVGSPTFEPRKVKVTVPHALLNGAAKLIVYADLGSIKGSLEAGTHDLPSVPVVVTLNDPYVSVSPLNVAAHYEVKQSDVSYMIDSIPIWVVYPPGMEDKYKAVYGLTLTNVTVTGPDAQIKALRDRTLEPKPKAMFEVSPEDAKVNGQIERGLRFDLPPGIQISAEDAKRKVQFKLEPHSAE